MNEIIQHCRPTAFLVLTVQEVIPATPTTRIVRLDLGGAPFAFAAGQAALIGPGRIDGPDSLLDRLGADRDAPRTVGSIS